MIDSMIEASFAVMFLVLPMLVTVYAATFVFGKQATFQWLNATAYAVGRTVDSLAGRLRRALIAFASDHEVDWDTHAEMRLRRLEARVLDLESHTDEGWGSDYYAAEEQQV